MGVGDEVAPRFTTKPSLKQEDGGKRLVFLCALEASPQPEITWFLGNTELKASDKHKMKVEAKGGIAYNIVMELIGVAKDDAGTYKVVAKNKLGEVSANINLNLGGAAKKQADGVAPNFTTKPSTRQVGKNLVMECQLTAEPKPSLEWFRDDAPIKSGGRITIIAESKGPQTYLLKLEIKDVANGDAGNYKVIAKNELGESNATIKLNFDSSAADAAKGKPMFTGKPAIRQLGDKLIIEFSSARSVWNFDSFGLLRTLHSNEIRPSIAGVTSRCFTVTVCTSPFDRNTCNSAQRLHLLRRGLAPSGAVVSNQSRNAETEGSFIGRHDSRRKKENTLPAKGLLTLTLLRGALKSQG
ncbi:unnamed protein product [Acanthosepion pharaonis]|uniref:Ig-like domain-containing protein n=1 Tax=Acanthosepion pharaonis TaxID=158019 RepID=A0A812BTJ2_ACAPH|nr:unnamed protein product [Sepia pharaonis]